MNKTKSMPDVAVLVLRIILGLGYLQMVYPMVSSFTSSSTPIMVLEIAGIAIFSLGSLLLILGFWTRWIVVIMVAYFIVLAFIAGWSVLLQKLIEIVILGAIWLINSGKYSVDHKLTMRTLAAPAKA